MDQRKKSADGLPLTADTMGDLTMKEAIERYPLDWAATLSGNEETREKAIEIFGNLFVQLLDELFPKELSRELIVRAMAEEIIQEEYDSGRMIKLPGNRSIEAKVFFAKSYEEQQELLHPEKGEQP